MPAAPGYGIGPALNKFMGVVCGIVAAQADPTPSVSVPHVYMLSTSAVCLAVCVIIASASVKILHHVTHFYSSGRWKILGRTVKLKPGFHWPNKKLASRASVSVTRLLRVRSRDNE